MLSRARERVSDAWLAAAVVPEFKPCVQSLQSCTGVQQRQLLTVEGLRAYRYDPMCGLVHAMDILSKLIHGRTLCQCCISAKTTELWERRTEIWTNLDDWFELSR